MVIIYAPILLGPDSIIVVYMDPLGLAPRKQLESQAQASEWLGRK